MPDVALLIAVMAACYLGFALLALSQDRHWHNVGGQRDCPFRAMVPLRLGGYALLLAALTLALVLDGPAFGSLLWATMLTAGALAVVCTLTWRACWLRPLVRLFRLVD
jgi:hypothetical protein